MDCAETTKTNTMVAMPLVDIPKINLKNIKSVVISADEELWLTLYSEVTKTDFLNIHGHDKMNELPLICFQKVLELFGMAEVVEQKCPGFVRDIFRDFESALFKTNNDIIKQILEQTTYFTLHMWKMCLEIGDFIMQHRVFLMTSYFMHLSSTERAVKETIELDKMLGGVFADHLLPNLPTTSDVKQHMMCSRKFLNILNISRGIQAKVISLEATELLYHKLTFHSSQLQRNLWIDFNFHNRYVSVWCIIRNKSAPNEVNMLFDVKNIILGVFSPTLTIEAMAPVKTRVFNGTDENLSYEDIFTFKLTENGFRLAKIYSDKLNEIKAPQIEGST